MIRQFAGPVMWIGTPTVDWRTVEALTFRRLRRVPLVRQDPNTPYDLRGIGQVDSVTVRSGGMVWVTGSATDLEPGRYPVGVDLDQTETDADGLVIGGSLLAVTVYVRGGALPAWPDAHIIVEES